MQKHEVLDQVFRKLDVSPESHAKRFMPPTPVFWGPIFGLFFDIGSDAIGFKVFGSQSGPEDVLSWAQDAFRSLQDSPRPPKSRPRSILDLKMDPKID